MASLSPEKLGTVDGMREMSGRGDNPPIGDKAPGEPTEIGGNIRVREVIAEGIAAAEDMTGPALDSTPPASIETRLILEPADSSVFLERNPDRFDFRAAMDFKPAIVAAGACRITAW